MHRREPRRRFRLDVATKQETRSLHTLRCIDFDGHDQRHVVVASRAELRPRPEHRPCRMSDAQRVAGCERLDPCPSGPERREQLPHGRVRALCHQHGFMQVRAADACIPRDIRQRAQVIEIRVGDDHGLDHSAALVDPRQKRTRSDISDRARAAIEEHEGRARLDGDRGPIADCEHRGLEVRDFPIDAADDGR